MTRNQTNVLCVAAVIPGLILTGCEDKDQAVEAPTAGNGSEARGSLGSSNAGRSTVSASDTVAKYSTDGKLIRPEGYREWVFVGTPLTPNDLNNGKASFPEFHNVYIDPASWEHYEKTGQFRDGTVIIKELISVGSKQAVSGNGYFMGDFLGLEATVKSAEHHPNEPGNWAYFSFGHEYPLADQATAFPASSCNSCHENVAAKDFVFTQHYPVLRAGGGVETQLGQPKMQFTDSGELMRPVGYRRWIYVGTPVTPNDMNNGHASFPEMHNVYIDPESWDHWKAHGEFPDNTIIIKELTSVGTTRAVSGNGYFEGDFIGLEATVKSTKHFPDEPGNWAYFSFGAGEDAKLSAAAFNTASCNACHETQAQDDFVFTQYYPVLAAAKAADSEERKTGGSQISIHDGANCDECQDAVVRAHAAATETSVSPESYEGEIPITAEAIFEYLQSGAYKSFAARESAPHPSAGPHTKYGAPVRVYLDPTMARSMRAGNAAHPVGAGIVKEMYTDDHELMGWAVSVKTHADSDDGNGWFWYEVTSTIDGTYPVAIGNGHAMCVGCHSTGNDFVLSQYPLK